MWMLKVIPPDPIHPLAFRLLPGHLRTIGRGAGATCIVDAPLISRVHCRITVGEDGTVEVTDLDSTNGTWIDGVQVKSATLAEGQILRVGRVEFVIERETPAAREAADEPGASEAAGEPRVE